VEIRRGYKTAERSSPSRYVTSSFVRLVSSAWASLPPRAYRWISA